MAAGVKWAIDTSPREDLGLVYSYFIVPIFLPVARSHML
jgi:hypothetical protein